jgi:hypothetical protein
MCVDSNVYRILSSLKAYSGGGNGRSRNYAPSPHNLSPASASAAGAQSSSKKRDIFFITYLKFYIILEYSLFSFYLSPIFPYSYIEVCQLFVEYFLKQSEN